MALPYTRIAPPAMIRFILAISREKLGEYADKILFIEVGSAPLPEADRRRLRELLQKTRIIINFGCSEAGSIIMYDCAANPGLINCIGKAMPHAEILIVDDSKNDIVSSRDRPGLIACRGDGSMKGYVNDPELTASVLVGVVYTNDIGYKDENGFFFLYRQKG